MTPYGRKKVSSDGILDGDRSRRTRRNDLSRLGFPNDIGEIGTMFAFLDFEASSLAQRSYPIEVAWVLEDGSCEAHLIAPAPEWIDWDPKAEAIHGIDRRTLLEQGERHDVVAMRMVEKLAGHELFASAPSWDGKWLSALLRAADLPRHLLKMRDTDEALRSTATEILRPHFLPDRLPLEVHNLIARTDHPIEDTPAHRALADAFDEYRKWLSLRNAAQDLARRISLV